MALELGTNVGFVTSAPVDDPDGGSTTMDTYARVVKDTVPANCHVTAIMWYCNNATEESNWEGGIYDDDGAVVPGEAGTLLFSDNTNAKGTTAGWKSKTVNWDLSSLAGTSVWIGVQLDDTSTATGIDYASAGGNGIDSLSGQTALPNPFGGGALSDVDGMYAICAVYTISEEGNSSKIRGLNESILLRGLL